MNYIDGYFNYIRLHFLYLMTKNLEVKSTFMVYDDINGLPLGYKELVEAAQKKAEKLLEDVANIANQMEGGREKA